MVKTGDLLVQHDTNSWKAIKILAVDPWPDATAAAHCLIYSSLPSKPTAQSLHDATVYAWHAPTDAGSFDEEWDLIGNHPPSTDKLVGFFEYLKQTDFSRYVSVTGQDSQEIVRVANTHYKQAYVLGDQGQPAAAIAEYSRAIDLLPLFYEAIDNRAFTYMELGMIQEALQDLEQSLRVNPNGMTAFFYRGECLMKLGDLAVAEAIFQEGAHRFPKHQAMFVASLDLVRALQRQG